MENEEKEPIEENKRIRTLEELKRLAGKCIASGEKERVLAGRIAKRAIQKATRTGWADVTDVLRAGCLVQGFSDLFSLDGRPTRWLWQTICREYGKAIIGNRYGINLGRHVPDDTEIAELCEEFAAAGFHVTPEAIVHNVTAWKSDMKAGYKGNNFFLFTPCGCNDLYLNAEGLQDGADWQTTYMA